MTIHGECDNSEMGEPNIAIAVRTLLTGGFDLENAHRNPGYMLFNAYTYDEFGALLRYSFVLAEEILTEAQINAAKTAADFYNSNLVVIGHTNADVTQIEWNTFINLFGGPIFSTSPLEEDFAQQLVTLSYNQLPNGLHGQADDLFEKYVHVALEFILGGRVVRYGRKRAFEARPDGIALPNPDFSALYDAKSYSNGYEMTLDSIRQFKSYVEDFNRRYTNLIPRLKTFLVISGDFPHTDNTLRSRSTQFLSQCGIPLSFIRSESLVQIIRIASEFPQARKSIDWARVFVEPIVNPSRVRIEFDAVRRNGLLRRH